MYHMALSFHVKVFVLSILRTFTMGATISCGQRSLVRYSPWGQKALDTVEYIRATQRSTCNLTVAAGTVRAEGLQASPFLQCLSLLCYNGGVFFFLR